MLTNKDKDITILQEKFVTLINQRKSIELIGDKTDILYFIDLTLNSDRQNCRDICSKFEFCYFRNDKNLEDLEEEITKLARDKEHNLENKYLVCLELDQIKIRFIMGFALQYNFRLIIINERDSKIFPDKLYITYSSLFLNDIYRRLVLIFEKTYKVNKLSKISDVYNYVFENLNNTVQNQKTDIVSTPQIDNQINEENHKEKKSRETTSVEEISKKTTITFEDIESMSDKLTLKEVNVLRYLVKNRMITRELLAKIVWQKSINEVTADAIDQFMSRLRRKITNLGYSKDILKSRKGYGFELLI